MNRLKSVLAAAVLTLALAVSVTGQATCIPGETQTPPCPSALMPDDPVGGLRETENPPDAQSLEIVSLVEFALSVLLLA